MHTYMEISVIKCRVVGTSNKGEDRFIKDDVTMPINHDVYEEASFYVQRPSISVDSETNDSDPPYRKAPTKSKDSKSQISLSCPEDDADVPLLNGIDGFSNYPSELTNYCREPMPVTNSHAWRKLVAATTMCLIFMVIELVGGYIAGSLAVMTDAAHLLSDCVGFLVGLFAVWISGQPPTNRFTYGYHRAEVLGALLSISVIWILTGIFVYLAVERLVKGEFDIHADAMMIVAAIGIAINIVMGCILHGSSFHHEHSHHDENINVRAAVVHVLGDLIQSTGVFISALVIKLYPNAKVIDPVCTFLCCLLVMCSTIPILRQSVWVLLECLPPGLDYSQLHSALSCLDGVQSVHALHVWALTPGHYVATAHLAVGGMTDRDEVLKKAQSLLHNKFRLERTTIQVERHLSDMIAQ
ncbi:proton-coupled zinc antiporter SLC30A2-like isoform X3 [Rhodnius prolixus]|uniref:proton-coupled zinc antiporter SLC30A2-like isoform X3 n=1 Tax=Rhodnius prolixus TaxID=13249 RepID=UPI003D18983A